jgi:hypothetical protein
MTTSGNKIRRERRAENRQRVFKSGVIKSSIAGMSVAQVLDTSSNGLRVTAPCPLPVDTQVQILLDGAQISGSVRNCVLAGSTQFHVGIGNTTSAATEVLDDQGLHVSQFSLFDPQTPTDGLKPKR